MVLASPAKHEVGQSHAIHDYIMEFKHFKDMYILYIYYITFYISRIYTLSGAESKISTLAIFL